MIVIVDKNNSYCPLAVWRGWVGEAAGEQKILRKDQGSVEVMMMRVTMITMMMKSYEKSNKDNKISLQTV